MDPRIFVAVLVAPNFATNPDEELFLREFLGLNEKKSYLAARQFWWRGPCGRVASSRPMQPRAGIQAS